MIDLCIVLSMSGFMFFLVFYYEAIESLFTGGGMYSGKQRLGMVVSELIIIISIIFMSIFIRENLKHENYKIDKTSIIENSLYISKLNIKSNKKLHIIKKSFDMPYSNFEDYSTYRIYLDSTVYIDIIPTKFDSLDLKLGKKLYKEE